MNVSAALSVIEARDGRPREDDWELMEAAGVLANALTERHKFPPKLHYDRLCLLGIITQAEAEYLTRKEELAAHPCCSCATCGTNPCECVLVIPPSEPVDTGPCRVNLKRNDEYDNGIIPDEDVETTLKVIRSLRNLHLKDNEFDESVLLSHAHACIFKSVEAVQAVEARESKAVLDQALQDRQRLNGKLPHSDFDSTRYNTMHKTGGVGSF
jgi:hypothetical protein